MMDRTDIALQDAIAIVGMAGRFPGANTVGELWQLLRAGREGIRIFSKEELLHSGTPANQLQQPNFVPARGYVERAEEFDAELFGYHPHEALVIDPQQRLLLECCWEALEDAGCDPFRFAGRIGVFTGVGMNSWLQQLWSDQRLLANVGWYQLMISNDKDYASTRISYQLNLRGPSIGVQTACSTSLVAIAQACQSLAAGECDMALAGAASLIFPRKGGYFYEEGMILSPDGHCRTFDARAKGTVPGEGAAIVVLKRAEDAIAHGYHIEALIRGWAVNNDGANKVGFTAPSIAGQAEAIIAAQDFARVSANSIGYIEAHGTATQLGDPIEIAALCDAFKRHTSRTGFCRIGSVKSNLGHLDTAAGIAGLIKTVLALKHRQLPASLHYETPNPEINFEASPFVVNNRLTPWETKGEPRRAGVSSFGIGGTNCHLVLEEAPAGKTIRESRVGPQLLVISGSTLPATDEMQQRLATVLERSDPPLSHIAFTLQTGRRELRHRRAIVCRDRADASAGLRAAAAGQWLVSEFQGQVLPPTFLFPGQGSQFEGMGKGLYDTYPVYRQQLDRCADILLEHCKWNLRDRLFAKAIAAESEAILDETATTQPAMFASCYALAQLLMNWGIQPTALLGHSIGEFVAACLSGVMTLEDALRITAKRGELMESTQPGAMLAVIWNGAGALEGFLNGRCEIASFNAPGSIVVSGQRNMVYKLQRELENHNITATLLRTSRGFHSVLVEPILEKFNRFLQQFRFSPPQIPFASTVTGKWATDEEVTDPDYWTRQMRQPVRFEQALRSVCAEQKRMLIEVGPGRVLQMLAKQTLGAASGHVILSSMCSRDSRQDDAEVLLETVGKIWMHGGSIHWPAVHDSESRQRVSLPTYAFQRREFSPHRDVQSRTSGNPRRALAKQPFQRWFYAPSWKRSDLPSQASRASDVPPQRWLIFADAHQIGWELGQRLIRQGHDVVYVEPGDKFQRLSENEFVMDPRLYGNYSELVDAISPPGKQISRILHGWTLNHALSDLSLERAQQLGFYSLLFLSQSFARRTISDPVRIDVLSSQMQDVLGTEQLQPAKSTIRAPLLVIPQEYPNVVCQHLDVQISEVENDRQWFLDSIQRELLEENAGIEVALRGRSRWVRMFDRVHLPAATPQLSSQSGAWIVIGGFGQIGLTAASWIAHRQRAALVLVSRASLPEEDEWDAWLQTHDVDNSVSQRITAVRMLRQAGVQVNTASADIADPAMLRQVVADAVARYGSIAGIVHSAGLVENRIIHYTSPSDCERQFGAKINGIHALRAVVDEFRVPVVLVNSSLSSILGGLGYCAYTASNLYLDAYLRQCNREGLARWVAINWDGWLFPATADALRDDQALLLTLSAEEGFECLDRIHGSIALRQVVVSTGDLVDRLGAWVHQNLMRDVRDDGAPKSSARHPRPGTLSTRYLEPRNATEKAIAEVWSEMLGIEQIGVTDDYIELGGHSLLAGQIIGRLRERLKTPLSIRALFEFPTIAQLALHADAIRLTFSNERGTIGGENRVEVEF